MTLATVLLAFLPLAASPEAEGVSSRKLLDWIDACERKVDCVHGFVLLRHGKLVAEGTWGPFDTLNRPHRLSSHSKCFVSTAAGMLVDEGRLDLDERVIDILPDLSPSDPSENLRMLRVRDLMTMTMGAQKVSAGWPESVARDWIRHKLSLPIDKRPGQAFEYDSDATHVLGEVVARKSGKPLMDFLKERLFAPLGVEKAWSTVDPTGRPCAGWGFNMTTREISLIGQLHLDRGVWNGRRLLSESWVAMATAKQTWSGKSATDVQPRNDWTLGFGFNIWRCQHGCFRADGAGGQFTIVMPEQEAVLSLNSDSTNMQRILDVVWEHLLPALSAAALPEDAAAAARLRERCAALALAPVAGTRQVDGRFLGRDCVFENPAGGVRGLRVDASAEGWTMKLTTEAGVYEVPVGFGRWRTGEVTFSPCRYEVLEYLVGRQPVAASGAVQEDGSFRIRMHLLDGTHRFEFVFRRKMFKPVVEMQSEGITWGKASVAKIR